MGQMAVQHGHNVAVGAEGARLDSVLAGKVFDYFIGYPACNLRKDGHSMFLQGRIAQIAFLSDSKEKHNASHHISFSRRCA